MTLSAGLYRDDDHGFVYVPCPEIENYTAAGFECYRSQVWGSQSLIRRGAIFLPQLRTKDLFVPLDQFTSFRKELTMVASNAVCIASEIWPRDLIARFCPVQRRARLRRYRILGARDLRTYIYRFRIILDVAERNGVGFTIG